MTGKKSVARAMLMSDDTWRRHANPWSVWTRFGAIPLMILAVWSRDWIGWGCLAPIALVAAWLFLNTRVFAPIENPVAWSSRGIYGEGLWVSGTASVTPEHRRLNRLLMAVGITGFLLIGYGLSALEIWPTLFGVTILTLGQLWRIDRFARLFDEHRRHARPE